MGKEHNPAGNFKKNDCCNERIQDGSQNNLQKRYIDSNHLFMKIS